jgi:dTDP-4-dehydrorhamnose reductase
VILVLGAEGMLGHRVVRALDGLDVIAPKRSEYQAPDSLSRFKLTPQDYVVNCIGAIPQKGYNANEMTKLNTHFPQLLAQEGYRVIQIATDCAFSGTRGSYTESDARDARDDYGLTKIGGELQSFMNLRTSIVGPELTGKKSLFEFVRNQPHGATIKGFHTHHWNGITTDAFGAIVRGVIDQAIYATGMQHVVPADRVTKYQLIKMFAKKLGREDLNIVPTITAKVDRTLATVRPHLNAVLWQSAGYQSLPTVQDLVDSMAVD